MIKENRGKMIIIKMMKENRSTAGIEIKEKRKDGHREQGYIDHDQDGQGEQGHEQVKSKVIKGKRSVMIKI